AVDSGYAVWRAFSNNAWPAVYLIDAKGRVRFRHFGEGEYERMEQTIQQLLSEAGNDAVARDLVAVQGKGVEAAADWASLRSGENYLGSERTQNFASPSGTGLASAACTGFRSGWRSTTGRLLATGRKRAALSRITSRTDASCIASMHAT